MSNMEKINKYLNNLSKIDKVMKLDDLISEDFYVVNYYRYSFCDAEARNIAKESLYNIEKNLAKRKEITTSDSCFDDVRSVYLEYEEACLRLVQRYRKEIALYE